MITPALPSSLANVVAPFSPVGKLAVGEENIEARNTPFKPVEEVAESNRQENRSSTAERAALAEERVEFEPRDPGGRDKQEPEARREKQQRQQEQQIVDDMAARDRQVRAHEQAHVSVGGPLAGSSFYRYERGPNGASYAVSGEVAIRTGQVSGDPEATLRNARIVQQAALAPADPSPQDRQVAAEGAQIELRAIQEIAARAAETRQQQAAGIEAERRAAAERREREDARIEELRQRQQQIEQRDSDRQAQFIRDGIDLNRRLIDIGAVTTPNPVGGLLDLSA